jgi:DNA polymerase III subunit epsilon
MSTDDRDELGNGPMKIGQETLGLSVRDVVERHGGAFWFERDRSGTRPASASCCPLANPQEQLDAANFVRNESRPEYYDFDLFRPRRAAPRRWTTCR